MTLYFAQRRYYVSEKAFGEWEVISEYPGGKTIGYRKADVEDAVGSWKNYNVYNAFYSGMEYRVVKVTLPLEVVT